MIARRIHLWVGVILALLLLMEAITGLILSEPSLVGHEKRPPSGAESMQTEQKTPQTEKMPSAVQSRPSRSPQTADGTQSAFALAKALHQGRFGSWNAKWLINLSAIGLIILTLSGIIIAIPLLRAKFRKHNRP